MNNYLSFLHKPNNENSKNMLFASHLAGKAINRSKTTGPHAVSYPFSAMFGLDHGHAVSQHIAVRSEWLQPVNRPNVG